ncbi:MAG: pilus assembly protein PilY, partial [Proteobacteria bacterium]|nr:pilus assembly protein PilY [Pseudomonadota bacterium]
MKKNLIKVFCLAALVALNLAPAQAQDKIGEDIYLFSVPKTSSNDLPNVLFLVDNTANWTSPFSAEMTALANAFSALPVDSTGAAKFRVGLMMFTETAPGDSNADGGYVRAAVRNMDTATQAKYSALIKSLDVGNDKSNGGKAGKTMVEVYRYLSGLGPYAGNNKNKTDYTGNASGTADSNAIYALAGNALASRAGTAYTAPSANGCRGTFVIYLSNGPVQDNNSDTTAATNELAAAGSGKTPPAGVSSWTSPMTLAPSGSQDNVADEWARFMYQTMGVTFFTIDVVPKSTGQTAGWSALLRNMAGVSQGTAYDLSAASATNTSNLAAAISSTLADIMSKIQSQNSAFSSVSLPVSVNTQGTYLNQVYMGMFRPDSEARPRWYGNLKQYKVGVDSVTSNLYLADSRDPKAAAGNNAVNPTTGFIDNCSVSYWTPTTADTYWNFAPSPSENSCLLNLTTGATSATSNTPDGPNVEKGAQAYNLRGITPSTRKMLTCSGTSCSTTSASATLANFDTNNSAISQTALDPTSGATNRATLINWARGLDNKGDERPDANGNAQPTTNMRPSVHGDVIHSRPVALNYGTDAAPQVVVFYGANDGALRAVAGNRSTAATTGAAAGSELWSFMPPEYYGRIKRTYDDTTRISYPDLTLPANAPTPLPKSYGMDGPMTAYQSADGKTIWLYAAMRRGGQSVYAFDVSSMGNPSLKWRRGCDEAGACTTGMEGIGQTWSSPKVFRAPGYGTGKSPMLIFGGGYDKCEDNDTTFTCNTKTSGNHIYIMDADTGALLKTFDTLRAVPGDITVINDATTGQAKIAYAADLGGNVYRINFMADSTKSPSAWTITQVASLGCDTVTTCDPNRKFMFGPDVVEDSGAYVVLLGSGDREKPLRYYTNAFSVVNRFYMLVDKPTDSTWLSNEGAATTVNNQTVAATCGTGNGLLCQSSLLHITRTDNPDPSQLATK